MNELKPASKIMKNQKALAPDKIPAEIFKPTAQEFLEESLKVFIEILKSGEYPK